MTAVLSPGTSSRPLERRYRARLPRRRVPVGALVPAAVIVVLAVAAPLLAPFDPTRVSGPASEAPSAAHLLGTDSAGLDVLSRVLHGARYDLTIALAASLLCTAIGIAAGLVLGSAERTPGVGGLAARAGTRAFDLVQAVPGLLIGLVVVSFFGASVVSLTVAMALVLAPVQMRLVRVEVLRVRGEAYLDAARMSGQTELHLLVRHVLPNSTWAALENMAYLFATSILLTASLGFVGVGLRPPTPEWGAMLSAGTDDALSGRWWAAAVPAVAVMVTVWAFARAAHALFGRLPAAASVESLDPVAVPAR
ncbi:MULTISPECIES: ABC transporter permease subunit [Curtobacterium]|uniref:ABC transporter permease n=1 Tax=Curtobacterium flaccumfaciens TaxID=2035 RepID=UPI003EE63086